MAIEMERKNRTYTLLEDSESGEEEARDRPAGKKKKSKEEKRGSKRKNIRQKKGSESSDDETERR